MTDSATWAAWAQAGGTVAAAAAALALIRAEGGSRRRADERWEVDRRATDARWAAEGERRRQDLDRATAAELGKVEIRVDFTGSTDTTAHVGVAVGNHSAIGLRSLEVTVRPPRDGQPIPFTFSDLAPGRTGFEKITTSAHSYDQEWRTEGLFVDATGARWTRDHLGLIARAVDDT